MPQEILFCNVINYYGRACLPERALQMFDEIPSFRCQRTMKSVNSLLNALLKSGEFEKMSAVFMGIEKFGKPDACTYNIMINQCGVSGCFDEARNVFDEMHRKGVRPDGVTLGTLIYGLCMKFKVKEAFKLKDDMLKLYGIPPNVYVYTSLIKGLCEIGQLSMAFRLKEEILKNRVKLDSAVYSTLINALFKAGRKDDVSGVLEEMREIGCKPDNVTYNVMINGYWKEKDFEAAYKLLDEMVEKGCKPDVISYNVILRGLCMEGKWKEACDLFEDMPKRGCSPDVVSYRILFDGLCNVMQFKEAVFILDEMIFKGYMPRHDAIHKLVHRLSQNGNLELLTSAMSSLGKRNAISSDLWEMAISMVCKEDNISCFFDLVNTFRSL